MELYGDTNPRENLIDLHREIIGRDPKEIIAETELQLIVECINGLLEMIEDSKDHSHSIH